MPDWFRSYDCVKEGIANKVDLKWGWFCTQRVCYNKDTLSWNGSKPYNWESLTQNRLGVLDAVLQTFSIITF